MRFKRYVSHGALSSLSKVGFGLGIRACVAGLLAMVLCDLAACVETRCLPACTQGYVCNFGQCQLGSQGKAGLVLCQDYCNKLGNTDDGCKRTTQSACNTSQCLTLNQQPPEERAYRARVFECYLAASCEEISDYLESKPGDFLRKCIGCRSDSDCPGGFRCDPNQKICFNTCQSDLECRASYKCASGRCNLR